MLAIGQWPTNPQIIFLFMNDVWDRFWWPWPQFANGLSFWFDVFRSQLIDSIGRSSGLSDRQTVRASVHPSFRPSVRPSALPSVRPTVLPAESPVRPSDRCPVVLVVNEFAFSNQLWTTGVAFAALFPLAPTYLVSVFFLSLCLYPSVWRNCCMVSTEISSRSN